MCIAIAEITVMITAHVSAYFPWAILLLSIPSAFHRCHCLRVSLRSALCHGAHEQGFSYMFTEFNSPFVRNPTQGDLMCPVWGPAMCLPDSWGDKADAGSGCGVLQLHQMAAFVHPGGMVWDGWCQLQAFKSRNTTAIFHICHPLSPRLLSSPVPALQVPSSSAKIIQLNGLTNNNLHVLSVSAAMGTHCLLGQTGTRAGLQCREGSCSEEGGQWVAEEGQWHHLMQQHWTAEFAPLSHLA